jgi:hypothetical protein
MCIVDLHDIELLDNFRVDDDLLLLELWNDLLTKVNGDNIIKSIQGLNFLISLYKINKVMEDKS